MALYSLARDGRLRWRCWHVAMSKDLGGRDAPMNVQRSEDQQLSELGWRRVTRNLPEDGVPVLCYWKPQVPGGRDCIGVAMRDHGSWHDPEDDEDDYRDPTHWMPLPEPPK